MSEERIAGKIGVDEIIEAAGTGALRALQARGFSISTLPQSGVFFQVHIVCGLPPYIDPGLLGASVVQRATPSTSSEEP